MIEAQKLTKIYGKNEASFKALKGLDLSVKEGETVAIIGKSGSGKSTLLHILALLDKPTSGSIHIEGKDVTNIGRKLKDKMRNEMFGFVFQQFFLNPNDSVLSNVILPLKIAGVPKAKRNRIGLQALSSVELKDKAKSKAVDLSGGQKQRVAIARALINEPKIIFADEPTGNLDTVTGKKIEDLLFSLNKDRGITLIFVTHDPDLAKRCDRQIIISDGKIQSTSKRAAKK